MRFTVVNEGGNFYAYDNTERRLMTGNGAFGTAESAQTLCDMLNKFWG